MSDEPEEPERKSAADNPWYVLMTVAEEQKKELIEDGRATEDDLAPLTEKKETEIAAALAKRCPEAKRPDLGDSLTFNRIDIDRSPSCTGVVLLDRLTGRGHSC